MTTLRTIRAIIIGIQTKNPFLGTQIYHWYRQAKKPNWSMEIGPQLDRILAEIDTFETYTQTCLAQSVDGIVLAASAQSALTEGDKRRYHSRLADLYDFGFGSVADEIQQACC